MLIKLTTQERAPATNEKLTIRVSPTNWGHSGGQPRRMRTTARHLRNNGMEHNEAMGYLDRKWWVAATHGEKIG